MLHWDKTPDVFLINKVNAFSSYSSKPGCITINLLSPKDAKYQAKAKQTDVLMHPWKEDTAQLYSCTISLELPDSCKNIIMEGVTKYYVDQPRMIQEVIPWESMRNISPFYWGSATGSRTLRIKVGLDSEEFNPQSEGWTWPSSCNKGKNLVGGCVNGHSKATYEVGRILCARRHKNDKSQGAVYQPFCN